MIKLQSNDSGLDRARADAPPDEPKTAASCRALRAWIVANASGLTEETLTDETRLFAGRYLSSLHVPELLLTLERLRGQRIDLSRLEACHLRDLASLRAAFLERSAVADAGAAGSAQTSDPVTGAGR
jgi:hypothetical protein